MDDDIPRAYTDLIGRFLYEHPGDKRELNELERTIEAYTRRPGGIVVANGNNPSETQEERVYNAKENSEKYQHLTYRVATIQAALKVLLPKEIEFIRMKYWKGMSDIEVMEEKNIDARRLRLMKTYILSKLAREILKEWVRP